MESSEKHAWCEQSHKTAKSNKKKIAHMLSFFDVLPKFPCSAAGNTTSRSTHSGGRHHIITNHKFKFAF